jgi:flagellum-specific peptidoglycan hydrolase FlgJ
MGRRRKSYFKKRFKIKARTKKKISKYSKRIAILTSIILGIYICYDINRYTENTVTIENMDVEKEKLEFVKKIEKGAKSSYKEYGILPSITIAQAILESGWGQSELTKNSNNVFGIKADSRWNGNVVEVMTTENYSDKVSAEFRKYNSIEASVKDHAKFLKENKRYEANGLFDGKNYKEQAQALENAGYSTKKNNQGEPIYADMLIELIEKYQLHLLD